VNWLTWRLFELGLRYMAGSTIEDTARAHGLARNDQLLAPGALSPFLTLVLSSPVYSPRQRDWPAHIKVTGHSRFDEPHGWSDPDGLDDFLKDASDPPVLVIASSANERDTATFFRSAAQALALTGRRGLLIGRSSDVDGDPTRFRSWPYLPLSRVAGRCALVVHHAGIGTALTAIRNGRPAVAVPAIFDQWYNADRIKKLGVGRVLPWKQFTSDRLAAEIDALAGNPAYSERAKRLGAVIAGEDGAGCAADEIEKLLNN